MWMLYFFPVTAVSVLFLFMYEQPRDMSADCISQRDIQPKSDLSVFPAGSHFQSLSDSLKIIILDIGVLLPT